MPRRWRRNQEIVQPSKVETSSFTDELPSVVGCSSGLDIAKFSFTAQTEDVSWVACAAKVFQESGFVIITNALDKDACAEVLETCRRIETDMLQWDPGLVGCRDPGRYSFGAASLSGHLLHEWSWRHLLDCTPVIAVLEAALPDDFRFSGGGGDFVRGGTFNYQALHSDIGPHRVPVNQRVDWPPPKISVNFTVQLINSESFGPMRIVPGHKVIDEHQKPPCCTEENEAMRFSKLYPLPPGAAILRDLRVWHAGTPNTTDVTRFLPNVELMSGAYSNFVDEPHSFNPSGVAPCGPCARPTCAIPRKERARVLPPEIYEILSPKCQKHCLSIVAASNHAIPQGVRPNFASLQQSWLKGSGRGYGKERASGISRGEGPYTKGIGKGVFVPR